MDSGIVSYIIMAVYAIFFACIFAVFEIRLRLLHSRHLDKIAPYGQKSITIIDKRLRIMVHAIFFILFVASIFIIKILI